ncbi:helix-turn-helix transcriptional regulator [Ferrovibrio sp.]|uniref:helix-turn-helix domain-containing protein n=1 Tax=Ferrovibrio sp. TaxID=1917215 RepID=UPI002621E40F|nr:helix-turn-helix transcriptional regulator [Ferrovibrio sp.]
MKARRIVAWNLRKIRVERGFTIEALGGDAEVDSSMVARIERGTVNSSIDLLERLANVLKVRIVEFFVEPLPGAPQPKPLRGGRRPAK